MGILTTLFLSCSQTPNLKVGENFIDVKGGKIWYKVAGESNKTPLVLLHGGPGYPSYSLNPLLELSKERPVIIFDQLGCGRSDRITDTSLMTIDNYVEQLHQLITGLNIKEFYLFGHSWGTMLGMDYYIKYPSNVKSLIFNSPCMNLDLWLKDADTLINSLPDSAQVYLKQSIRNENTDSLKMKESIDLFYNTFYTRKKPKSKDFLKTIDEVGYNVYEYMWGKEDYVVTGTLKGYDRTKELTQIKVPTLYITGEYDAARPSTVKYYQSLTPNSKFFVINNSGHQTAHDNPIETIKVIQTFINDIENDN